MDAGQALRDGENALRDFISLVLEGEKGVAWVDNSGVSADRIAEWRRRQEEEERRLPTGTPDARLIYYADFYDLKTILKKNWSGQLSEAFGKFKTIEVFLDQLESFRNPEAHRRELLTHQKHLVVGISGYIRNRIARYRSSMETSDSYYPRLESVSDNFGNSWVPKGHRSLGVLITDTRLRVGDSVELVVAATDPKDESLEYAAVLIHRRGLRTWQDQNVLTISVGREDVRRAFDVRVRIRSRREFHARSDHDDEVVFRYEVLPPRPDTL